METNDRLWQQIKLEHKENREDHRRLFERMGKLEQMMSFQKAKVAGLAAIVSAGVYLLIRVLG